MKIGKSKKMNKKLLLVLAGVCIAGLLVGGASLVGSENNLDSTLILESGDAGLTTEKVEVLDSLTIKNLSDVTDVIDISGPHRIVHFKNWSWWTIHIEDTCDVSIGEDKHKLENCTLVRRRGSEITIITRFYQYTRNLTIYDFRNKVTIIIPGDHIFKYDGVDNWLVHIEEPCVVTIRIGDKEQTHKLERCSYIRRKGDDLVIYHFKK